MNYYKWFFPSIIALVVVISYQLLIAPIVKDILEDWSFLHQSRMIVIQKINSNQAK